MDLYFLQCKILCVICIYLHNACSTMLTIYIYIVRIHPSDRNGYLLVFIFFSLIIDSIFFMD